MNLHITEEYTCIILLPKKVTTTVIILRSGSSAEHVLSLMSTLSDCLLLDCRDPYFSNMKSMFYNMNPEVMVAYAS